MTDTAAGLAARVAALESKLAGFESVQCYTMPEAAALLKLERHTIVRLLNNGELKGWREDPTNEKSAWRIPHSAIVSFIKRRTA